MLRIFALIISTILVGIIILCFTKYQKISDEKIAFLPLKLVSLIFISYTISFTLLWMVEIIGGYVTGFK